MHRSLRLGLAMSALVACLRIPLAAHAGAVSDLRAGIKAYEQGTLERAQRLLRSAVRASLALKQRARALLYLGLVRAELRDFAEARRWFRKALHDDPLAAPDPERTPPSVLSMFAAIRRSVLGEVRVTSDYPGVRVYVDERGRGFAPLVLRLPVGKHVIRSASTDGFRTSDPVVILVEARHPQVLRLRLVARYGRLRILGAPSGARVLQGKRLLATTPVRELSLPAGRHRLTLRAADHAALTEEILVIPQKIVVWRPNLVRLPVPWYRRKRTWAWISAGLSGAGVVTALLAGRSALANRNAIEEGLRAGTLAFDRYEVLREGMVRDSRVANAFFVVSGAAAVTSLVLFLVSRPRPKRRAWNIDVGPAALSVRVRF